jgi:hypothetical protein
LTENPLNNGQIPIDPRTALTVVLVCLTSAVALPPEQLQNFIALLDLALTLAGRR